jgi:uncharacterized protein YigA (DUF484 family)
MTTKTATDPAAALRLAARETAIGLGAVARGKAETHTLESDAKTFKGIARILDGLNEQLEERDALVDKLVAMHRRIADLQIRGATQLLEQQNWRKIATELQAIAQEAINIAVEGERQQRRTDR